METSSGCCWKSMQWKLFFFFFPPRVSMLRLNAHNSLLTVANPVWLIWSYDHTLCWFPLHSWISSHFYSFHNSSLPLQICQPLTPCWRIQLLEDCWHSWLLLKLNCPSFFPPTVHKNIAKSIKLCFPQCLGNIHGYFETSYEMTIWMAPKPSMFHTCRLQDPLKVAKAGCLTDPYSFPEV